MFRNICVMAFVFCAGLFAADKPAAQARQEMESEARGESTTVIYGSDAESVSVSREEFPIVNASFERTERNAEVLGEETVPISFRNSDSTDVSRTYVLESETDFYDSTYSRFNSSSKPAAQARLEMERSRN